MGIIEELYRQEKILEKWRKMEKKALEKKAKKRKKSKKKMKKEKRLLIDLIFEQLVASGNFEEVIKDSFGDGSGQWISCYHSKEPNEEGKRYSKVLLFSGDGNTLENFQVWEESQILVWDDENQKELK